MSLRRRIVLVALIGGALAGWSLLGPGRLGDDLADAADAPRPTPLRADSTVDVSATTSGAPIPAGFLGLSVEYWALTTYTGNNPQAIDPVLEQLVRNIATGGIPSLRIGGDSTDKTWWPVGNWAQPRGVMYSLTPSWLAAARALSSAINARLLLGVNLEANNPLVSAAEASALVSGLGSSSVQALELGNEPNWYSKFAFYRANNGLRIFGRPAGYSLRDFTGQFSQVAGLVPPVPLAGPTIGGNDWLSQLRQFVASEPALGVVTLHRYPLNRCYTTPGMPDYPSIRNLLSPASSTGLAATVTPYVRIAHASGLTLRVDELNSVACGGKPGVSDTFASALWSVDALFAMAHAGVDGVNVHTFPGAAYQLFTFARSTRGWVASLRPEYYGLLLFARAAPAGSHLLRVFAHGARGVRAWATRALDGRVRVTVLNTDVRHSHVVRIAPPISARIGMLTRLLAPNAAARRGITLGGQSFGAATATGRPVGTSTVLRLSAVKRSYTVALPAASAAMLTLVP
jgi:hypothetical protein